MASSAASSYPRAMYYIADTDLIQSTAGALITIELRQSPRHGDPSNFESGEDVRPVAGAARARRVYDACDAGR